jgi:hypothetical protein
MRKSKKHTSPDFVGSGRQRMAEDEREFFQCLYEQRECLLYRFGPRVCPHNPSPCFRQDISACIRRKTPPYYRLMPPLLEGDKTCIQVNILLECFLRGLLILPELRSQVFLEKLNHFFNTDICFGFGLAEHAGGERHQCNIKCICVKGTNMNKLEGECCCQKAG